MTSSSPHALRTARFALLLPLIFGLFLLPATARAITIVPDCAKKVENKTECKDVRAADGSVKQECSIVSPAPGLDCVLLTFGNIANLILSATGSFALLMFVYGGFMMLSSGGAEDRVTQGKTIIRNAVIGIFLVLLAGYLIRYGLAKLGVSSRFTNPSSGSSVLPHDISRSTNV